MFRPSQILQVGPWRFANRPLKLSPSQKQRVRKRLKEVDAVMDTLLESNVQFKGRDEAMKMKREHELTPKEKYYVFSRDPKTHMKPIINVPHFTKMPHPRGFPPGY